MKKLIIALTFISFFHLSKGQDSIRHFEFGSTLITVNSFEKDFYYAPEKPPVEWINGLFFRYSKKRFGLRAHTSYTDNSMTYGSLAGWADGSTGDIRNRDFRIGMGGQFSLIKRREWLYIFTDLSYRNVFSSGHYYGGIWGSSDRFVSTANGFDSSLGLGFKLKIVKNLCLSPEVGYCLSSKFVNKTTTSLYTGQSSSYIYSQADLSPSLKLHLTARF